MYGGSACTIFCNLYFARNAPGQSPIEMECDVMKHEEVIAKILNYHPVIENYAGGDEYKAGNPKDECTGIVSALVPTVEVIRKTAELGCNLIITHEPIYYQTPDFPGWRGAFSNAVQEEKEALINQHRITVWRDHDHMHTHRPDSIFTGVIKYLGWEEYYKPELTGSTRFIFPFVLPKITVEKLGCHLKEKMGLNGLRYIGNPSDEVERAAIVGHLVPGAFGEPEGIDKDGYYRDYSMTLMECMEHSGIQAIIPGEVVDWTILSYIRDAVALGMARACYNVGHFNMEELGMRYAAEWLAELTGHSIPVHYVPSNDMYSYS